VFVPVMKELQRLFGNLIRTNQKWVDPSNFLKSIVDNNGNIVKIGAQEDVSGNLSLQLVVLFYIELIMINSYRIQRFIFATNRKSFGIGVSRRKCRA
jgi:hypothetical protein